MQGIDYLYNNSNTNRVNDGLKVCRPLTSCIIIVILIETLFQEATHLTGQSSLYKLLEQQVSHLKEQLHSKPVLITVT